MVDVHGLNFLLLPPRQRFFEDLSHGSASVMKLPDELSPLGLLFDLAKVANDEFDRCLLQNFSVVSKAGSEYFDGVF